MISIDVRIDKKSFTRARNTIDHTIAVLSDLAPTFDALHPHLLANMRRQFATQGKHGGSPWILLSMPVRALTNLLQPSLTQPGHQDHVFLTEKDQLTFGSRSHWTRKLLDSQQERAAIFAMTGRQKNKLVKMIADDLTRRSLG